MMDPEHVNAYVRVIRKKFSLCKFREKRWRLEDCYYFEDMKEPIGQSFKEQLKENCSKYERLIFPMLTFSSIHWACALIDNSKEEVRIVDSTYRGEDLKPYGDIITNALKKVTNKNYKLIYHEGQSIQFDNQNCGIHTLKNMEDLMLEGKTKAYTYNDKAKKDENRKILQAFRDRFKKEITEDQKGEKNEIIRKILQVKIKKIPDGYVEPGDFPWKTYEEDLETLKDPKGWLNDEVIKTGFELIRRQAPKNVKICDPAFYPLLKDAALENNALPDIVVLNDFKRDVQKYEKIYFPYNFRDQHWLLIEADNKRKILNVYNPEYYTDYTEVDIMKALFKVPFGDDYQIRWRQDIPHQTDGFSCGMFCMENLKCIILKGGVFNYTQADLPKKRKEWYKAMVDANLVRFNN